MKQQSLLEKYQHVTKVRGGPSNGAEFSPCRQYRYSLWRRWEWNDRDNCMMVIGLNPSTADETKDDPTIRSCIGFAKSWGFDGLYMLNLYSFRATNPADMVHSAEPVGSGNDESFCYYQNRVGLIVAAWGSLEVRYRPRVLWQSRIKDVLSCINQPVYCLGKTKDGSPRHPLYVKGDTEKQLFWSPAA